MGFLDRLKELGSGVGDMVKAPIGLIWDTVRALPDKNYNPGSPMGVIGPNLQQFAQGVGKTAQATGIATLGSNIADATLLDEGIKAFFHEGELIMNQEYQVQQNQAPIGLRSMGVEPGDVSLSRVGATATGAVGTVLPGGRGIGEVANQWQLSKNRSPGQAFIDDAFGLNNKTPEEVEAFKANAAYSLFTGTLDATFRWFTQPEILAGKGARLGYSRMRPDVDQLMRSRGAQKAFNMDFQSLDDVRLRVSGSRGEELLTVVRRSSLEDFRGRKAIADGADAVREAAPMRTRLLDKVEKNFGTAFEPESLTAADRQLLVSNLLEMKTRIINSGDDQAIRIFEELELGNVSPSDVGFIKGLAVGEAQTRSVGILLRQIADGTIDGAKGIHRTPDSFYLMSSKSMGDAERYASKLFQQNPSDPPVILRIDPQNLSVVFDDLAQFAGTSGDRGLVALLDDLPEGSIKEVLRPNKARLTIGDGELPDHLKDPKQLNPRLFNPDGTAIDPGDVFRVGEHADAINAAKGLMETGGEDAAVRFLKSYKASLDKPASSSNMADFILNNSRSQRVLNWMEGKSAAQIRERLFPNHTHGALLSRWFSEATTYTERRAILASSMGIRTPENLYLTPLLESRIKILTGEMDRLKMDPSIRQPIKDTQLRMMADTSQIDPNRVEDLTAMYQRELSSLKDSYRLSVFQDTIAKVAPVRRVPVVTNRGEIADVIRNTTWYQENPLARPIRSVTEMKPKRFLNLSDNQSDVQIMRQLEEAAPLGISREHALSVREAYLTAETHSQKLAIVISAENDIIKAAAKKAGLSIDEMEQLLNHASKGRQGAAKFLASRRYSSDHNMDIVRWYDDASGEMVEMAMPMLSTQLQNWVPLADVRQIKVASSNIARQRHRIGEPITEVLDSFYNIWKPTVLLRGGWPIRVVSDEQLRILTKTGSLVEHLAAIEAGQKTRWTGIETTASAGVNTGRTLGAPVTATVAGIDRVSSHVSRALRKLKLVDEDLYDKMVEAGTEKLVSSRSGFLGPHESVNREFEALLGRHELGVLDHLITRSTGNFTTFGKESANYAPSWERALKQQLGQDPLARVMLERLQKGMGSNIPVETTLASALDDARRWLKNTPEGAQMLEDLPWRANHIDNWTEDILSEIVNYTADLHPSLIDGALSGKVNQELLGSIDDYRRPTTVHGEILDQTLGKGAVVNYTREVTSTLFDVMGRLPTDTLSRQPYFRHVYAKEMQRMERIARRQNVDLNMDDIKALSTSARQVAIDETQRLLYDLTETSRFGEFTRHIFPFFPAWQEVLSVWSGLALHDPSVIGKANLIWNAPEKAGMVQRDPDTNDRYIVFSLSEKMQDKLELTGWKRYVADGGIRVGQSSFNLMLNSPLPGVGPPIQMAVNEVVKERPDLEESLEFLLPYGVKSNSMEVLLSPIVKRLDSAIGGLDGDKAYERDFINALVWNDFRYRTGELTVAPTPEDARDVARAIFIIRSAANAFSPAQPIFDSPLKPYVDIYRSLIDDYGYEKAQEMFLTQYGEELMAVTFSRTQSTTGIPASVEAHEARKKFEDLINTYPEYGRLIVGDEGVGEFSSAAFAWQLTNPADPNDPKGDKEREYRRLDIDPRTGGIEDVDSRLGWQEYIRMMDLLEVERKSRGLPSLAVKDAQDLAAIKRASIEALAGKYPTWWEDFNTRDGLKWDKRITALKDITASPYMDDRPDMVGIKSYLEMRSLIIQELNHRKQLGGSSTLTAGSNQDLAYLWESVISSILEENVAFAPVYYRYLEGEPLTAGDK